MRAAAAFVSLLTCACQVLQTVADSSACSSGIYAVLAPLETYPPAVTYCQSQAGKTTVTVTATVAKVKKRVPAAKTTTTTTKPSSTTTAKASTTTTAKPAATTTAPTTVKTSTTTSSKDAKASQWSSLVQQAESIIATFCSCAGYPATTTKTVTPTTTTTSSTTASTTASTTPSTTASTTASTTTSAASPTATVCSDAQHAYCNSGGGCFCDITIDHQTAFCSDTLNCYTNSDYTTSCNSDADCAGYGSNSVCVYSPGECGRNACATNQNGCPAAEPNTAKRALEKVFQKAGRSVRQDRRLRF